MTTTKEENEIQNAIQFIKSQEPGIKISSLWEEKPNIFYIGRKK